jgi:Uncharacterized protein conserved in bacteria (DUF2188)
MTGKTHHVVPNPKGGWSVKKGGATKASRTFLEKQSAVNYAKKVSKKSNTHLVVHKRDGTIQRSGG